MKFSESLATLETEVTFGKLTLSSGSVTAASTASFPNKNIMVAGLDDIPNQRVGSETSNATPSIDCELYDIWKITALTTNITSVTITGTPTDGQFLQLQVTGTASRTIALGTGTFAATRVPLSTSTSGTNKLRINLQWDADISRWCQIGEA